MTLMEVCKELDIVPNTAYSWIARGILRPLPFDPAKQRKRYKFDKDEILARKRSWPTTSVVNNPDAL